MHTREEVVAMVAEDLGIELPLADCDVVADPFVKDVYAIRHRHGDESTHYLLTPEGAEEVVFTDWPPTYRL